MPEITVVVVNYNSGDYLRGCLESLATQTFRDFEVIVVDNASADGSLAATETVKGLPSLTVLLQDTNLGFAAANNLAARAGSGRWLALLNPDAAATPTWLEALLRAAAEHPDYRMLASLQLRMDDPTIIDGAGDCYLAYGFAWRGGYGHPVSEVPAAGECFSPCGASAMYPRDLFLEAGGFDETFFAYLEDVDLAYRLRLQGQRCQFVPDAVVHHAGSAISSQVSGFAMYHGMRNGIWLYVRDTPTPLLVATAPVWAAMQLTIVVLSFVRRDPKAIVSGTLAGLRGVRRLLRERRRTTMPTAMSWNPLDLLTRRVRVRPLR